MLILVLRRQMKVDFKASLVYRVCFRRAKGIQRNPVSNKRTSKQASKQ